MIFFYLLRAFSYFKDLLCSNIRDREVLGSYNMQSSHAYLINLHFIGIYHFMMIINIMVYVLNWTLDKSNRIQLIQWAITIELKNVLAGNHLPLLIYWSESKTFISVLKTPMCCNGSWISHISIVIDTRYRNSSQNLQLQMNVSIHVCNHFSI